MNVPPSVVNAARQGLVLIVSPPDPTGRVHKWRSKLTDSGFLLTAEDGVRYLMPVLDGAPEMIREDLVPALHYYLARVDLEIGRGDDMASAFFATRLTSVVNENPSVSAGWYDERLLSIAIAALIERHPDRFGDVAKRIVEVATTMGPRPA